MTCVHFEVPVQFSPLDIAWDKLATEMFGSCSGKGVFLVTPCYRVETRWPHG